LQQGFAEVDVEASGAFEACEGRFIGAAGGFLVEFRLFWMDDALFLGEFITSWEATLADPVCFDFHVAFSASGPAFGGCVLVPFMRQVAHLGANRF